MAIRIADGYRISNTAIHIPVYNTKLHPPQTSNEENKVYKYNSPQPLRKATGTSNKQHWVLKKFLLA